MKKCPSPTGFFKIDNLFGELWTDGLKTIARKNLGITGTGGIEEITWGNITGNINDQKDLIQFAYSLGIPILTLSMYDTLTDKPEKYIVIPEEYDLLDTITNNTYTTTTNGTYMDVLFSAIRSLQSEVARLKNAFKYGINSYTDNNTAMASVLTEPSEEPLWAVDESDLSSLPLCSSDINENHILLGDVVFTNNILSIKEASFFDPEDGFKAQPDPKTFVYLTSSNANIDFILNNNLIVNISKLVNSQVDLYNILFILSKKTTKTQDDPTLYGNNYIWILIINAKTNSIIKLGYYNNDDLQPTLFTLNELYYIEEIKFKNLQLSKFNSYVKYLDFSYEIIPTQPNDLDYKFGAAHITIRSVKNKDVLNLLKKQLQDNELIWVEATKNLCIKSKGNIYTIGGTVNNDNMTESELIASLQNLGIIVTNNNDDYDIKLNNISEITFIHEETGKKFNLQVDSEGTLRSTPINDILLENRLKNVTLSNLNSRGFISKLRIAEANTKGANIDATKDVGLLSDRLKIGAIYAPIPNRTLYGCSHAYIELENTSDEDINLKGCSLYIAYYDENNKVFKLPLTGTIKAGSTYLIRGKQYTNFNDANTVIKVDSFDLEWYIDQNLIDLQKDSLSVLLMYGTKDIKFNETLVTTLNEADGTEWKIVDSNFIDGVYVRNNNASDWIKGKFTVTDTSETRDYILKNTFELDPAKQAFQAINSADSSRVRGANANDFKPFYIDEPIIRFPHSDQIYDVSLITPQASYNNKNISTDKSKLDTNKPNMVYCSFGINVHTTRCFNWISVGYFDEYVWIRKQGDTEWQRFESYKPISELIEETPLGIYRSEPSVKLVNSVYARISGRFPGDNSYYTSHKCILKGLSSGTYEYVVGRSLITKDPDLLHISEIQTFTVYPQNTPIKVYHITDLQGFYWMEYLTWAGSALAILNKIQDDQSKSSFIPIIINTGDVTLNGTRVNEWLDYYNAGKCLFSKYEHMSVVGNNDLCGTDPTILGTGDDVGKSNGFYHHVFNCYEINTESLVINNKYVPSTYYFDCLYTNYKIRFVNVNSEITFINCRDWFGLGTDNTDVAYNIYTGWTTGNASEVESPVYKSATSDFTPIYNTLYQWLKESNTKCIVSCHEIPFTVMTRQNLSINSNQPGYTKASRSVDGKTNGNLVGSHLNQLTKNDNKCLYWFSRLLEDAGVKICLGGHKHTYTCTYPVREFYFYDNKNSLTNGPMPMSPTLENDNISWEFTKNDSTLITTTNNATFTNKNCFIPNNVEFHTSRLPLVDFTGKIEKISYANGGYSIADYSDSDLTSQYLPIINVPQLTNGVIYFMCLATGYKQTSNKELPGTAQAFSKLLPLTQFNGKKDTASTEQQLPMFGILTIDSNNAILLLARIKNVLADKKKPLYNNIGSFSTLDLLLEYISLENTQNYIAKRYGVWDDKDTNKLAQFTL